MSKKNPSWGGRFSKKPSQIAQNFSSSVDVDQALYNQDIQGSIAYAEALMEAKVLSKNECNKIKTCLLYTSPSPRDKRQSRMPSSA